MKHLWKIIAIFVVLGICLVTVGAVTGANTNGYYIDKNGLHLYSRTYSLIQERNLEEIYTIHIDAVEADVRFVQAEDYGLEIYSRDDSGLSFTCENGNLVINRCRGWHLDFMKFGQKNECVTIYLPENAQLDNVEIKSASGSIDIDAIQCKAFCANLVSGDVNIGNIEANDVAITTVSGTIEIKGGKANSFDFHLVSGNLRVSNLESGCLNADFTSGKADLSGMFTGNTKIHGVSGSVMLKVQGAEQHYNRRIEVLSGRITINGIRAGEGDVNYHADNMLDIKTISGNIDITFLQ